MDRLLRQPRRVERKPAGQHLQAGSLIWYDTSSSYFEGVSAPAGRWDLSGQYRDPAILTGQVHKARQQFKLKNAVFVADRDMLNSARIEAELRDPAGLEWITVFTP